MGFVEFARVFSSLGWCCTDGRVTMLPTFFPVLKSNAHVRITITGFAFREQVPVPGWPFNMSCGHTLSIFLVSFIHLRGGNKARSTNNETEDTDGDSCCQALANSRIRIFSPLPTCGSCDYDYDDGCEDHDACKFPLVLFLIPDSSPKQDRQTESRPKKVGAKTMREIKLQSHLPQKPKNLNPRNPESPHKSQNSEPQETRNPTERNPLNSPKGAL